MLTPRRDNARLNTGEVGITRGYVSPHSTQTDAIGNLLAKLDKVKRTGNGTYMACCPSHADKSPSLTIRETDDGTVLIHCFAGCSVHEVLHAVGMELSDLFPKTDTHHSKPQRRPFPAADVLRALAFEALVVASCGVSMSAGTFTQGDRERLILSVQRIQAGLTAAGVAYV